MDVKSSFIKIDTVKRNTRSKYNGTKYDLLKVISFSNPITKPKSYKRATIILNHYHYSLKQIKSIISSLNLPNVITGYFYKCGAIYHLDIIYIDREVIYKEEYFVKSTGNKMRSSRYNPNNPNHGIRTIKTYGNVNSFRYNKFNFYKFVQVLHFKLRSILNKIQKFTKFVSIETMIRLGFKCVYRTIKKIKSNYNSKANINYLLNKTRKELRVFNRNKFNNSYKLKNCYKTIS